MRSRRHCRHRLDAVGARPSGHAAEAAAGCGGPSLLDWASRGLRDHIPGTKTKSTQRSTGEAELGRRGLGRLARPAEVSQPSMLAVAGRRCWPGGQARSLFATHHRRWRRPALRSSRHCRRRLDAVELRPSGHAAEAAATCKGRSLLDKAPRGLRDHIPSTDTCRGRARAAGHGPACKAG